ncbi:hypothetical protein SLEP1_g39027 [Rubroshorea leprosula]|uniref:Uncharacterized protein n=1 Tax=Rubroshorea leprosula TaxID=152421 RepID=A0AAV5KZ94_9ROSI|nr:hypothetical protein SLEP1_g39027 [Rubroshorea leprosula]
MSISDFILANLNDQMSKQHRKTNHSQASSPTYLPFFVPSNAAHSTCKIQ